MLRICLSISLFVIISCKTDVSKEYDYKEGTFLIEASENYDKTIIIRKDSIQIEKYNEKIDTFLIEWEKPFYYTLKMLNPKKKLDKEIIHTTITTIKENKYEFESRIGYSDFRVKGEAIKLK